MENRNIILTEKQQKYLHYHQVKLINKSILQVKKYYLLIEVEFRIEQVYILSFRKSFRKTNKKQVDALKSLNLSNKTDELKLIECIFPKNWINDLIRDRLKEIIKLQNSINLK